MPVVLWYLDGPKPLGPCLQKTVLKIIPERTKNLTLLLPTKTNVPMISTHPTEHPNSHRGKNILHDNASRLTAWSLREPVKKTSNLEVEHGMMNTEIRGKIVEIQELSI
jgi:hypothetical protein